MLLKNILVDRLKNSKKPCSLNTSSYVRARQRLPLEPMIELTRTIGREMEENCPAEWRWKNRKVRLVDGSTVAMSDTPHNQAEFPQNSNQKDGHGYPLSRISLLTSLETGSVLDFNMGPFLGKGLGELHLARGMLNSLNSGDVLVGDAYYLNYSFLCLTKERGIDFVSIKKKNAKFIEISSQRISAEDRIIRVEKVQKRDNRFSWVDKQEYEGMPETLKLRETTVTIRMNGFRTRKITLVSTILNSEEYTPRDLADLFLSRWNIETDLRNIKRILNMDFIKPKSPDMVRKDCWAHLLAYNLVRRLMNRIGKLHAIRPKSLSFKQTVTFAEAFFSKVHGAMDRYYLLNDSLLILKSLAIKARPERFEPRAIKNRRGNNSYPSFEVTRKRWKMLQIWPYLLTGIDMKFSKGVAEEIEKQMGVLTI